MLIAIVHLGLSGNGEGLAGTFNDAVINRANGGVAAGSPLGREIPSSISPISRRLGLSGFNTRIYRPASRNDCPRGPRERLLRSGCSTWSHVSVLGA